MIVSWTGLREYRGRVAMVDGGFDPLHLGHIEYFLAALELGLPLLCSVTSDAYVRRKHEPLLPEEQRLVIIDNLRMITYTHLNRRTTEDVLRQLRPRYYVKGKDWEGRLPPDQVRICGRHGIGIVFLDTVRFSSTQILRRFQSQ